MLSVGNQFEDFLAKNYVRQTAYQTMFADGLLSGVALRNLILKPYLTKPYKVVPKAIDRFDKASKTVLTISGDDPEIMKAMAIIDEHWQKSRAAKLEVLELMKSGDKDAATEVLTKEEHPNWQKVRITVQKLVLAEEAHLGKLRDSMLRQKQNTLHQSLLLAAIAIFVGGFIALFSIRGIKKAFSHVIDSLTDIASGDGDLTQRLDESGNNEVAQLSAAFNRYVEKIHTLVKQVSDTSQQLTTSAQSMSDNSVETKLNLNQQETEIEKVAAAINEMATTVQEVSRHASNASAAALSADDGSSNGYQVVTEVIAAINDLAGEVQQISLTISSLKEDSVKIGTVLDVIKDIAEQTNLLALNAAIEAARAGEQGRGFAVVADEVRTLASRTQQSTQEIQEMIEHLQNGALNATLAIDKGQDKTQTTVDKAQVAGKALSDITHAVSKIVEMNTQIATAAEEQSAVAEEINRNVSSIKTLSGKTATGAEYTAASSQELSQVAENLQQMISSFSL